MFEKNKRRATETSESEVLKTAGVSLDDTALESVSGGGDQWWGSFKCPSCGGRGQFWLGYMGRYHGKCSCGLDEDMGWPEDAKILEW